MSLSEEIRTNTLSVKYDSQNTKNYLTQNLNISQKLLIQLYHVWICCMHCIIQWIVDSVATWRESESTKICNLLDKSYTVYKSWPDDAWFFFSEYLFTPRWIFAVFNKFDIIITNQTDKKTLNKRNPPNPQIVHTMYQFQFSSYTVLVFKCCI